MYEHSYRQIPMAFVNSPKTRRMTHFQFRFALLCMMNSTERWQLPFEENALIRMADPYDVLQARNRQVIDCRALFLSADLGFFIRARFRDEEGLVIAEEFRREVAAEKAPNKGAMPQLALPLPDELSVVPRNNALRLDHEKKKYESPRVAPATSRPNSTHDDAMMNRSDAAGRESGSSVNPKFARSPDHFTLTPLGRRLGTFLGRMQMAQEMVQSGAYWQRVLEEDALLLEELLDEGERRAVDFTDGKSRAKFLSKRLKERKAA